MRWNGADRPTTWISPATLEAQIPAADLASTGQALVTVFTPPPGGGESEARVFNVNETFLDVPTTHFAAAYIQAVYDAGVSRRLRFSPLLSRSGGDAGADGGLPSQGGPGVRLRAPPCTGAVFGDVPCQGGAFDPWIEDLALRGLTGGCGGGNYCPGAAVTRAQMAAFLLKTSQGQAYLPPPCTGAVFNDVPCQGGAFDAWIEDLFARGVTGGCGGGNYCPVNAVTRAQMAVFLTKMFNLSPCFPRERLPQKSGFVRFSARPHGEQPAESRAGAPPSARTIRVFRREPFPRPVGLFRRQSESAQVLVQLVGLQNYFVDTHSFAVE